MKKKIALLLAAVMSLSMLPTMGLFAAAGVSGINATDLPEKSLIVSLPNVASGANDAGGSDLDIEYVAGLSGFSINGADTEVPVGHKFQLALTNAKWVFAQATATGGKISIPNGTATPYTATLNIKAATNAVTAGEVYFVAEDGTTETGYISYAKVTAWQAKGTSADPHFADPSATPTPEDQADYDTPLYTMEILSDDSIAYVEMLSKFTKSFTIPYSIYMEKADTDVSVRVEGQNTSVISTSSVKINTVDKTAGTTVSISDVNQGRNYVTLGKITIAETVAGVLKDDGYVSLTLDDDFIFSTYKGATVKAEVGLKLSPSTLTLVEGTNAWLNKEGNVLTIKVSTLTSEGIRGKLFIEGLVVAPNEDKIDEGYYGTTLKMTVEGVTSYDYVTAAGVATTQNNVKSLNVSEKTIDVAKFADYGTSLSFDSDSAKVVESYSGKVDIKGGQKGDDVAVLKFAENAASSWFAERELTIQLTDADGKALDGVKINTFEITDVSDVAITKGTKVTPAADTKNEAKLKDGKVTLSATSAINKNKLASMKFTVTFNAAADFVGDVYVRVSGYAVSEASTIKVATISAPIKVSVVKTNVPIGVLSYTIGAVTITENYAGALARNKKITMQMRELGSAGTDVTFNPLSGSNVTIDSGNIKLDDPSLDSKNSIISINVSKASTEASTITINGLKVKVNRSVPYGEFDLMVGGAAWNESYDPDGANGLFDVEGFETTGYVKVATPSDTVTIAKNVVITIGTTKAIVDGVETDMGASTYIDPASNRTMLPLRAVAYLFNISEDNIIWDKISSTATIIIESSTGSRIVSFTTGSSKMKLNGVDVDMVDENGVAVKAMINPENERMYIPLRQLGTAYGIDVLWVPGTPAAAIFNPTDEQIAAVASNTAVVEQATTDETTTDETDTDETDTDEVTR